jgi:hypothetical protein
MAGHYAFIIHRPVRHQYHPTATLSPRRHHWLRHCRFAATVARRQFVNFFIGFLH